MPSSPRTPWRLGLVAGCLTLAVMTACNPRTPRSGDEIIVAGQFVHTGARVVTWQDPGGYNAYRADGGLANDDEESGDHPATTGGASTNRYDFRQAGLTEEEMGRVRRDGWDLPTLQQVVDELVLHYDVSGTSRESFKVMHRRRGLSVHFLLDLDGTIYQTLDVKERAWHAAGANTRSVGIEIANVGAYGPAEQDPFAEWYAKDAQGRTRITLPARVGDGGLLTKAFVGHPARPDPVKGVLQGRELTQYDFTPQQYTALIQLTAALCKTLPKIKCDYPRDPAGNLITQKLPDDQLAAYQGLLGHFHIQTNKVDPGPAFQWDYVLGEARKRIQGTVGSVNP